jgi:hypothetical protein
MGFSIILPDQHKVAFTRQPTELRVLLVVTQPNRLPHSPRHRGADLQPGQVVRRFGQQAQKAPREHRVLTRPERNILSGCPG